MLRTKKMMKKAYFFLSLFASMLTVGVMAKEHTYQVNVADIYEGYITEKIWLTNNAVPVVSVSAVSYIDAMLPPDAAIGQSGKVSVGIGMERKRPFALVRIPAYVAGSTPGSVRQVSGFTLELNEKAVPAPMKAAAKTTTAAHSVLSSGTWYKIGVTKTGFYKIDNSFISSLGLNPSDINPANVRVFGNGGNMLSEANYVPRNDDLAENTVLVNGGGSKFNAGDYVAFYATGPLAWTADMAAQRFNHSANIYSDTAYYFITFDHGAGKRVSETSSAGSPNRTVVDFNYYDVHDIDLVNPVGLGKRWYGEQFGALMNNTTQSFSFDAGSSLGTVDCKVAMGCTQGVGGSRLGVAINGQDLGSAGFGNATNETSVMAFVIQSGQAVCNSQNIKVDVSLIPSAGDALGYLDYVEINARRPLVINGDQMSFRDLQSVGAGNVASYQLQGANGNTKVWDVTNRNEPVIVNGTLSGGTYSFAREAESLHEFAAMNGNNLYTPKYIGKVGNQDIHGSGPVDMIIVANPKFSSQAQQLADYHSQRDNMRVLVATTEQVYNEFSSGAQDISAIRDLCRMFYKRAGMDSAMMPKYLLLFGGASYDYKNRIANNSNFVPVFESEECFNSISGYSTDDFYGFLDDSENIEESSRYNTMDIGVGRLPARNTDDADVFVKKIVSYKSAATLGPWRMAATIVGDNGYFDGVPDGAGNHMQDAEDMSGVVDEMANGLYNQTKVYLDAIPIISTPAGMRCPGANAALNDRVYKGTFMINYNGHGNPQVWSHERILKQEDYSTWNNEHMLPFMVTATCDFGQFDHPQFVSAAEQLVERGRGGVITVLTTTAAVYAHYNNKINQQYLREQFTRNGSGRWNTFGEACRRGKNVTYALSASGDELVNFYKFALLGDPALEPDFPEHFISIDGIKDGITLDNTNEIKALGKYVITGKVKDKNGNTMTGFNGLLWLSMYDKPRSIVTLTGHNDVFKTQDNFVYKGKVNVVNGAFEVTFIAPKDINYNAGAGKISSYAHNGVTDAAGVDTGLIVGGFSDNPQLSTVAPIVRPYINDSLFQNGGITGSNTSLFVALYSETGINVSGNNLGHDLIGILDENVEQPYILNDYYETAPNTYQRGFVNFPVAGLANGRHTIRVKAWDVNNNSGDGTVDFMVVDGQVVDIQNLMNYPNPFANSTRFVFEHNHPDEEMNVEIGIFNTAGALVRTIQENIIPSGSRTNELSWDGTDNGGARLSSGMYVYRLNITTAKGFKSTAYQKLVIVR
jgi:hypothetical protein